MMGVNVKGAYIVTSRVHAVAGQIAERARAHDRTRGASRSRVARAARLL
jgi:hypothetical protein